MVIAKPIRDSLGLAPGWISIQRLVDDHVELLISDVALVETAYVLASTYGVPRETVVDHLIALLRKANTTTFRLPKEHVLEALTLCRPSGRVSFERMRSSARRRGRRTGPRPDAPATDQVV